MHTVVVVLLITLGMALAIWGGFNIYLQRDALDALIGLVYVVVGIGVVVGVSVTTTNKPVENQSAPGYSRPVIHVTVHDKTNYDAMVNLGWNCHWLVPALNTADCSY
jgi:chloramphenicol 3-O-phosphotransferase